MVCIYIYIYDGIIFGKFRGQVKLSWEGQFRKCHRSSLKLRIEDRGIRNEQLLRGLGVSNFSSTVLYNPLPMS